MLLATKFTFYICYWFTALSNIDPCYNLLLHVIIVTLLYDHMQALWHLTAKSKTKPDFIIQNACSMCTQIQTDLNFMIKNYDTICFISILNHWVSLSLKSLVKISSHRNVSCIEVIRALFLNSHSMSHWKSRWNVLIKMTLSLFGLFWDCICIETTTLFSIKIEWHW